MDLVWSRAVLYEPPQVLGKTLRGFAPFHALALCAVQSSFMSEVGEDTDAIQELVVAVRICSLGWADRYRIVDEQAIQQWGGKIDPATYLAARQAFAVYLGESWEMPQFWSSEGEGLRANWIYHLVAFGMRELKMTEAEAWDCPIARLVCYRACVGESEGDKSLKSEEEIKGEAILEADKVKAEQAKEAK